VDGLTREFLLESQEGLDRMERCLTDLETRPGDTELLAEIFRSVHTIRGTTGFPGFGRLEVLSHAGENLLGLLRNGSLAASPEIISGLLALMDSLRSILRAIEATGAEGERCSEDGEMIARLEGPQNTRKHVHSGRDTRRCCCGAFRGAAQSPDATAALGTAQRTAAARAALAKGFASSSRSRTSGRRRGRAARSDGSRFSSAAI